VRLVLFETGYEGWEYATHGGTLFLVNFRGKVYGLTCRHVLKDFDWPQLRITEKKFGQQFARLRGLVYPSDPRGEAVDTDILDIAVIEFAPEVTPTFFADPPYVLDTNTAASSNSGNVLYVNGLIKEKTELEGEQITPMFSLLEFCDRGATSSDVSLREAYAEFASPEFTEVTGISGAPVFNATSTKLAGMVVRGALDGSKCTIWYVDIFDIMQFLTAVAEGRADTDYTKTILGVVRTPVQEQ
jgi:hypothetical protein